MSPIKVSIYGLIGRETREVFYVGQTSDLETRMQAHRNYWGVPFDHVVLEECGEEEAFAAERKWIEVFAESGLKNMNARELTGRDRDELICLVGVLGLSEVANKVRLHTDSINKAMAGQPMWTGSICLIETWLRRLASEVDTA